MKPPPPRFESAVPRTLQAQLEVAKAIRTLLGPDEDERLRQRHAEIASLRRDFDVLVCEIPAAFAEAAVLAKAQFFAALKKYSPDQPRVPAGNRDGGQWTNGGVQFAASAEDDSQTTIFGSPRGGHHFVAGAVFRKLPLKPETRQVFESARTGPPQAGRHGWSVEHAAHNEAVEDAPQQSMNKNGIKPEEMTPAQAQDFVYEVIGSRDPRIREFNLKIYRREIMYYLRRVPPRATE